MTACQLSARLRLGYKSDVSKTNMTHAVSKAAVTMGSKFVYCAVELYEDTSHLTVLGMIDHGHISLHADLIDGTIILDVVSCAGHKPKAALDVILDVLDAERLEMSTGLRPF